MAKCVIILCSHLTRPHSLLPALIERAQFAYNPKIYAPKQFPELVEKFGFEGSWLEWFLLEIEGFHGEFSVAVALALALALALFSFVFWLVFDGFGDGGWGDSSGSSASAANGEGSSRSLKGVRSGSQRRAFAMFEPELVVTREGIPGWKSVGAQDSWTCVQTERDAVHLKYEDGENPAAPLLRSPQPGSTCWRFAQCCDRQ
jgi:hypothetical protein